MAALDLLVPDFSERIPYGAYTNSITQTSGGPFVIAIQSHAVAATEVSFRFRPDTRWIDRDLELIRIAIWRKEERRRAIQRKRELTERERRSVVPMPPPPRARQRVCSSSSRYATMFW